MLRATSGGLATSDEPCGRAQQREEAVVSQSDGRAASFHELRAGCKKGQVAPAAFDHAGPGRCPGSLRCPPNPDRRNAATSRSRPPTGYRRNGQTRRTIPRRKQCNILQADQQRGKQQGGCKAKVMRRHFASGYRFTRSSGRAAQPCPDSSRPRRYLPYPLLSSESASLSNCAEEINPIR